VLGSNGVKAFAKESHVIYDINYLIPADRVGGRFLMYLESKNSI